MVDFSHLVSLYGPHQGGRGPVRFVVDQLFGRGEESPDKWQLDVLWEFGEGTRNITIAACHGPGKTALAAWCILYALLFRFPLKAVATAPTRAQLEGALMKEVAKWAERLPPALSGLLEFQATSVRLKSAPTRSFFEARTARLESPEALQGIHEAEGWVLLVVDEASGVPEKVFEAAVGSMSQSNAQTLLLANPTRTSGFFFRTHHDKSGHWKRFRVSWRDSRRVSQEFCREIEARYGRHSNTYRVRVEGLFPQVDTDVVIPYDLVDAARTRDIPTAQSGRPVWGLDVARFGDDDTALVRRSHRGVLPRISVWHGLDTMQVTGRVHREWLDTPERERPVAVFVDAIGIGAGVADRLQELGVPVQGVNVSESSTEPDRYRNLRTELAFRVKQWLERRDVTLPACDGTCRSKLDCVHDRLAEELTSVRYDVTSGGRVMLEPKKEMKRRGLRSPNLFDAMCLTFCQEPLVVMAGARSPWAQPPWDEPVTRGLSLVV